MSILVRRINLGKWKDYSIAAVCRKPLISRFFNFPKYNAKGDLITKELSTSENTLSFWMIPDESHLNDAFLAMCTGPLQSRISTLYYLLFDEKELSSCGIKISQSSADAQTAVAELKNLHYNVINVDYHTLGMLQDMIVDKIRKANRDSSISKGELKPIFREAITNGKIDFSVLSEDYLRHLRDDFKDLAGIIPDDSPRTIICSNCGSEIPIV